MGGRLSSRRLKGDRRASSALERAVEAGSAMEVDKQLAKGADPNQLNSARVPLLHRATFNYGGDVPVVLALLRGGADPNSRDKDLSTPLHAVVDHIETVNSPLKIIRALVEHGADVNARNVFRAQPLFICAGRHAKIATPRDDDVRIQLGEPISIVHALLDLGAEVNGRGFHGQTPLMKASTRDWTHTAELLLEHGADVSLRDNGGWSALHIACLQSRDIHMALLLLSHGADIDVVTLCDSTPLVLLAGTRGPHTDVWTLLAAGACFAPSSQCYCGCL